MPPRSTTTRMNQNQHIQLVELGDHFWDQYSRLIAEVVSQFPPELEHEVLAYLQDKSSVYGSKYPRFVKRPIP